METAPALDILPLHVEIETESDVTPGHPFAGVWARGVLLSALSHASCLCGGRGEHDAHCPLAGILGRAGVRPFAIARPHVGKRSLRFDLLLYADACQHAHLVLDAACRLSEHGIGEGRTKVSQLRVRRGERTLYDSLDGMSYHPGEGDRTAPPWAATEQGREGGARILLDTPLDLSWRTDGGDPTDCLSAEGMARAVAKRWMRLARNTDTLPPEAETWAASFRDTGIDPHGLEWVEFGRRSARQQKRMQMRGLMGEAHLSGNAPWGSLARALDVLPVGARTAFGFGSARACAAQVPQATRTGRSR